MGINKTYANIINLLPKEYISNFGSTKKKCFTTYHEEEKATVNAPHLMVTRLVYCNMSYRPIENEPALVVLLHILKINNDTK